MEHDPQMLGGLGRHRRRDGAAPSRRPGCFSGSTRSSLRQITTVPGLSASHSRARATAGSRTGIDDQPLVPLGDQVEVQRP